MSFIGSFAFLDIKPYFTGGFHNILLYRSPVQTMLSKQEKTVFIYNFDCAEIGL